MLVECAGARHMRRLLLDTTTTRVSTKVSLQEADRLRMNAIMFDELAPKDCCIRMDAATNATNTAATTTTTTTNSTSSGASTRSTSVVHRHADNSGAQSGASTAASRFTVTDFSIDAIMGNSRKIQHKNSNNNNNNNYNINNNKRPRPKKYQCPYCWVALSNTGQFRGHIRIHTGERPFKCDQPYCQKTFTRNEELTRHKRIHTGQRPYACELCGKCFGRKDHLKKHMRTHEKHQASIGQQQASLSVTSVSNAHNLNNNNNHHHHHTILASPTSSIITAHNSNSSHQQQFGLPLRVGIDSGRSSSSNSSGGGSAANALSNNPSVLLAANCDQHQFEPAFPRDHHHHHHHHHLTSPTADSETLQFAQAGLTKDQLDLIYRLSGLLT